MRVTILLAMVTFVALSTTGQVFAANAMATEQAVIVHFDYGQRDWAPFFRFEATFEETINKSGVGEYDGNELAKDGSDGTLYMYGPDADKIFALAKPILLSTPLLKNISVTLRYGGAHDNNVRRVVVRIGS